MKKIFFCSLILAGTHLHAQYTVRLIVNTVATRQLDDVYLAGNFNGWNPKDENYKLKPFAGSRKSIVIKDVPAGTYAFKFTRGGFDKVECAADGRDISDRVVEVNNDTSLEITVTGWKDDYPERPKPFTASPQVRVLDTAFNIPQLDRKRRIWVYLPKGYALSSKTYPVLYMQDGQNLFNEQTAAFGEWGVDECLDTLQRQLGKECIVVGIDHGGSKRMTEYNPYDHEKFGTGEGKAYINFLAHTLKPYIDTKFRTRKGPDYNFVAGSSMGGLISLCAVIQYPDVFGGAGVFSPAFWAAQGLYADLEKFTTTTMPHFYFYAGSKESATMVSDMQKAADILQKKKRYLITTVVNPLGKHNETYWRQEFAAFYEWFVK
jgi:metallo-beta-lactamase class B